MATHKPLPDALRSVFQTARQRWQGGTAEGWRTLSYVAWMLECAINDRAALDVAEVGQALRVRVPSVAAWPAKTQRPAANEE